MIHPISTANPVVDIRPPLMRHPINIDYTFKAIVGIASPVLGAITILGVRCTWRKRWKGVAADVAQAGVLLSTIQSDKSLMPAETSDGNGEINATADRDSI